MQMVSGPSHYNRWLLGLLHFSPSHPYPWKEGYCLVGHRAGTELVKKHDMSNLFSLSSRPPISASG